MSSFIIQDETINKLVNFFINCSYSKEEYKPEITRQINKLGFILEYDENEKIQDAYRFGRSMKRLNILAWNKAYNKKCKTVLFEHDENANEKNIYQILKSLQCFLYQCSEGDIPKDNLYITLNNIEKILINYIISHLEDYKRAEWN